jgi:AcrR family transcriptional regulator
MASGAQSLDWVRPPQQARSHQSLERILDAAEGVVTERGFEGAPIAEIVRRAQSSVGVFYARFRDKDALLSCMHDRFCDRAIATTDAALDPERWEGCGIQAIMETVIPFMVRIFQEKAGLIRAFIVRCSHDEKFMQNAMRMHEHMTKRLEALMLPRRSEIRHPDPALAIDFGLRLVLDKLGHITIFSGAACDAGELNSPTLGVELTRVFLGYLGVESAPKSRRTSVRKANGRRTVVQS